MTYTTLSRRDFLRGVAAGALTLGSGNLLPLLAQDDTPIIFDDARYSVKTSTITYAQGLTHSDWNSSDAEPMDLLADVYEPEDAPGNRPAIVMIHGGGFRGGTRKQDVYLEAGPFFASRGWVAISISYRLLRDHGTVPAMLPQAIARLAPEGTADQALAIYPAARDAKAAVRWVYANAATLGINTGYITSFGGSAGAVLATMLGVTDPVDYTDEIGVDVDPTLATTNLDQPSKVHTIIDFWGSGAAVEMVEVFKQVDRFDSTDAPIMIVHGTNDRTVLYSEAEALRDRYEAIGVPYMLYTLEGRGQGAWGVGRNRRRQRPEHAGVRLHRGTAGANGRVLTRRYDPAGHTCTISPFDQLYLPSNSRLTACARSPSSAMGIARPSRSGVWSSMLVPVAKRTNGDWMRFFTQSDFSPPPLHM
ncbi:MAG: alpha/beta hydrolase [Chloroflexota bacterium]